MRRRMRRSERSRQRGGGSSLRIPALLLIVSLVAACAATGEEVEPSGVTSNTSEETQGGSDTTQSADNSSDSTAAPSSQGDSTIIVAASDFEEDTLDPSTTSRGAVQKYMLLIWDTLLEIGPDGELAPGVAESWEQDESGLIWTFHLREGIEFHDGWGELTAEDVKFSLERFTNPAAESTTAPRMADIIDRVEVVDDYTVEVHTTRVDVGFPYLVSPHQSEAGIIYPSKYLLEEGGADFESQSALLEEAPIGSGPFKFVSRERGSSYTFEAVDSHWRSTPGFKNLEILLVPEPATQEAMLLAGEADIIDLSGDQVAQVEGAGMAVATVPNSEGVILNFTGTYRPPAEGKPTTDRLVRRALSLAIDRQLILDTIAGGFGSLPTTPWNTLPDTADIDEAHFEDWAADNNRYDPEEARALLAEAGYPDGFSGINMWTLTTVPVAAQVGEIIAAQWAEIGVEVSIVNTDYGNYRPHFVRAELDDETNAGDAGTYSSAPRWDAIGALNTYWKYQDGVVQYLNDPELDQMIVDLGSIVDDDQRTQAVSEAFDYLHETWAAYPIFNLDDLWGINPSKIRDINAIQGYPYYGRILERMDVVG
jgi:peptide/nickel transport system substrate-binding protein